MSMLFKEYRVTPVEDDLRSYQIENKLDIYKLWELYQSVMLQMPTGTGKTRLFASLCREIFNLQITYKTSLKILLVAHRIELIEQIKENIGQRYNMSYGVIKAGYETERNKSVQIASIQTLNKQYEVWKGMFDLVIIDEAHHATANTYKKLWEYFPQAKFLGVTATPYRLNGGGFKDLFDTLIVSKPVRWFIENKYLCDYDYYSVPYTTSEEKRLKNLKTIGIDGDYRDVDLIEIYDTVKIRAKLFDSYLKYAKGKKGIIYTISKSHNLNICKVFEQSGVKIVAIDSSTKPEVRKEYVNDFKQGKIDIICNVDIFSEGFDCPDVEFIQLARPTKSLSKYLQQVGRGLRFHLGKDKGIILDNCGLFKRFGLPNSSRKWKKHFEGIELIEQDMYITTEPSDGNKNQDYEELDEELVLISKAKVIDNQEYESQIEVQERVIFNDSILNDIGSNLNDKTSDCDPIVSHLNSFKFIKRGSKTGVINHLSEIVLEPIYDRIYDFDRYGYAIIEMNDRIGVVNTSFDFELNPIYNDISRDVSNDVIIAIKEKDIEFYDLKFNHYIPDNIVFTKHNKGEYDIINYENNYFLINRKFRICDQKWNYKPKHGETFLGGMGISVEYVKSNIDNQKNSYVIIEKLCNEGGFSCFVKQEKQIGLNNVMKNIQELIENSQVVKYFLNKYKIEEKDLTIFNLFSVMSVDLSSENIKIDYKTAKISFALNNKASKILSADFDVNAFLSLVPKLSEMKNEGNLPTNLNEIKVKVYEHSLINNKIYIPFIP